MATLAATFLLAGCATPKRDSGQFPSENQWQGRLSVRIESAPPQSMSAAFHLQGTVSDGELTLTSPLGTTLANARWGAQGVLWQSGAEVARFDNLDALGQHLSGTSLPFAALMDWLQGIPTEAGGWQVNLQDFGLGRISAQRVVPEPAATLRILLDRS